MTGDSLPRTISSGGKKQGIEDVAFAKKRNLKVPDMVRSSWVYRQLRRFRAGIEGCISMLKRVFGVDRWHLEGLGSLPAVCAAFGAQLQLARPGSFAVVESSESTIRVREFKDWCLLKTTFED